jgi:hypothetical protein
VRFFSKDGHEIRTQKYFIYYTSVPRQRFSMPFRGVNYVHVFSIWVALNITPEVERGSTDNKTYRMYSVAYVISNII